ncbi:hypothetical protein GE061_000033 [Apolygus lucorum]|uniref:PiggyBac transposable element-derived protein domain-containing protein n=1 Tax=Apolygus lucorum TaxID=248454 RepID=A0A8S9Y330_APOLU|nr:hypothetical protein GE061_000033 [Apolygus lucorum]
MKVKQFWTLNELEDAMQDPAFLDQFDDGGEVDEEVDHIDIVKLPPDNVDVVSDYEEIDEEDLDEDCLPKDVPGLIEVHTNIPVEDPVENHTGCEQSSSVQHATPSSSTSRPRKTKTSQPGPSKSQPQKKIQTKSSWKHMNANFEKSFDDPTVVENRRQDMCDQLRGKSAVELFELFFTETVLLSIVKETVKYAVQNNRHNFSFSVDCLRKFLGILLFTGYHHLPQEKLYWSEDEDLTVQCIRQCMSRNRNQEIKRYLHFNDNSPALGTVRSNRTNKCPTMSDEAFKKENRGSYDYRFDDTNDIMLVTWKDNNIVRVMNCQGVEKVEKVKRWSKEKKSMVPVPRPKCISSYNKYMGGVDKLDWLVNEYRIKIRGKKWYFPIITHLLDVCVVNAHVLHGLVNDDKMPLLEFRRRITRSYLSLPSISNPKLSGRPSLAKALDKRIPRDVEKNQNDHYVERTEEGKQRKCAVCKKNARKQCSKCDVGIHIHCMAIWHC